MDTEGSVQEIRVSEDTGVVQKVSKEDPEEEEDKKQEKQVHIAYKIFWSLFGFMQVFLFLRFVLEFLEANPDSLFYIFIMIVTAPLMLPFERLFTNYTVVLGQEMNTLFAMFAYFMLAIAGIQIINLFHPVEK